MRRTAALFTGGVVAAGSLTLGVPEVAHAASPEFGHACSSTTGTSNATTVYATKGPSNPLPVGAPQAGVITKARITLPVIPGTYPFEVKALRSTGAANQYTVIGQSATLDVGSGTQTYAVRIPVAAGDLLGTSGYGGLYCPTPDAGDVVGTAVGDVPVGTTATFAPATSRAIPVVATVEPDADKDGYGDETQDLCPQLASVQSACPVVKVDSSASLAANKIKVVLTTNNAATVKVTGIAKVNGKKYKLKGGTKAVAAGVLTTFKVKLPKGLKAALATVPRNKSIKVTLTSSATDSIGRVTTDKAKVKLPGTHR